MDGPAGRVTGRPPDEIVYRAGGSGIAWNEIGGEIVVLDLATTVYFGLNASAAQLWKRLTSGATRHELTLMLMEMGIDGQRADDDVDQFLAALSECGLLIAPN